MEECDDGNLINTDACTSGCLNNVCGDGIRNPEAEACDDGNTVDDDECNNMCELAGCGDGVMDAGEECDDGNTVNTDACTAACTIAVCGDAIVYEGMEDCDDGNTDDTDDCLQTCASASCGDTFVWAGNEDCDDGNTTPNDGCSDDCVDEPNCYGFGSATCSSGATQHCHVNAITCDSAEAALIACQVCQGAGNACANNVTECTDALTAIDAAACPNAVSFVYSMDSTGLTQCEPNGAIVNCADEDIAGDWCTLIMN
jgi:cysteine-rich repeat protein